jgi:central kinetochore subunit Mis15/CHL4
MASRLLSRLRTDELVNIALLWLTIPQTVPKPSNSLLEVLGLNKKEFLADYKKWLDRFKAQKGQNKTRIVDKLIVDVYPRGLNLLQLATLDSQLLVSKPNSYSWLISQITSHDSTSQVTVSIEDPQRFLQSLVDDLSTIYLTHVYISRHPHYPLILIRVQLFDLTGAEGTSESIISRKPVLIGIPSNSDKILITQGIGANDTASDFVIHALEHAVSKSLNEEVKVSLDVASDVVQNLESAFIIAGNSRYTESLGPWAPYASGEVDISPFDDVKYHDTFKKREKIAPSDAKKRIAMMRFKGGVSRGKKAYEGGRKRRKKEQQSVEEGNLDDKMDDFNEDNEYASIVPIQNIEFEIKNGFKEINPSIKIRFQGGDVFGGLHELCDLNVADAETIPGWLTGENITSGTVEDGVFKKIQKKDASSNGSLI